MLPMCVQLTGLSNTSKYAKAGVALRDSQAANARTLNVVSFPTDGTQTLTRTAVGALTAHTTPFASARPIYLRVSKVGNVWTGYSSVDGATWKTISSATMAPSTATLYAGLVVTSNNNAASTTATFTNVVVRIQRFLPLGINITPHLPVIPALLIHALRPRVLDHLCKRTHGCWVHLLRTKS